MLEHSRKVAGAAFGPADRRLATYDCEGNLRLWDAQSGRHELDLTPVRRYHRIGLIGQAGVLAVVTGQPQAVLVWDLAHAATTILERRNDADTGSQLPMLTFATLSAAGEWLASTRSNLATIWDIAQGPASSATLHHSQRVRTCIGLAGCRRRSDPDGDGTQHAWWQASTNADVERSLRPEVQQVLAERHLLALPSASAWTGLCRCRCTPTARLVHICHRADLSDLIA